MKSFIVSSALVLVGLMASAKVTPFENANYKCTGYGDGGGGIVLSIKNQTARAWVAEYATSTEGEELENTVLKSYRCPYCFDISATSGKATHEISLRGATTQDGYSIVMAHSIDGQKVMPLANCQIIK